MRDIDLKTLRHYVAVCDARNMARAAEQEHIEPSAVSKRMAQLEADLGASLLQRGRRGVAVTAAGAAVLEHARNVPFTVERIAYDAGAFGRGATGHVRLVATASAIVSNFDAAFRVVAANLAISVMPVEAGSPCAARLGVKLIPLADAWAQRRFSVCFQDIDALQPAARRLVDHLVARAAAGEAAASAEEAAA